MGFADDVLKIVAKQKQEINNAIEIIATDLFTSIVKLSPSKAIGSRFSTGLFINNWKASANSIDTGITSAKNAYGVTSLGTLEGVLQQNVWLEKDGYISFTNSLDYANIVEKIGWRITGPYAMVAISIKNIANKYGV